jgi:hypothetical protein
MPFRTTLIHPEFLTLQTLVSSPKFNAIATRFPTVSGISSPHIEIELVFAGLDVESLDIIMCLATESEISEVEETESAWAIPS